VHKGLPYAETVTRRTTLTTRCHKANRLACTHAFERHAPATTNPCCVVVQILVAPHPGPPRIYTPTLQPQLESCTSAGVGDGAAGAILLLGTSIARDSKRKLYTLRPLAPMLLPTRHKFGTAADDPRHYQPGKHVTCARTRAFVHAKAFMQHEPCSPRASTPI
jgi:hypothetical protein